MGSWAPSFTWKANSVTKPVWMGYFNSDQPLDRFQPAIVISELDESESDKAYISQGIDLQSKSDSVRVFRVWRYDIGIYWIRNSIK